MQVANLPARAGVIKPPSQNPCIDCGNPTNRTKAAKRCHSCAGLVAKFQNTAMYRVQLLINQGVIAKPGAHACVDCGAQATCYDHRDYSKPWAVEPVCDRCNTLRGPAKAAKAKEKDAAQ